MEYIVRVNALLDPSHVVLDYGAGHGKWRHDPVVLRRKLGDFRGRCAQIHGCDVDPAVLGNPQLDEGRLVGADGRLPYDDATFDIISAFSVIEHVEDGDTAARELDRVLKPGGWFCAWTPNKWGYVGVGARLVPKSLHKRVLRLVEPRREDEDSFPPVYRMNTTARLKSLFPTDRFEHCSYMYDGQPFYHMERPLLARFWRLVFWLSPPPLKGFHMVFIRKRA